MKMISLAKLTEAFGKEKAKQIRALLDGEHRPEEYENVQRWVKTCYSMPSKTELLMEAFDEILNTHGVEALRGNYVDGYHQDIVATYCNTGDTYAVTILCDHVKGKFLITSYGDFVGQKGERYGIV